jgi:triacylglycerol lipase
MPRFEAAFSPTTHRAPHHLLEEPKENIAVKQLSKFLSTIFALLLTVISTPVHAQTRQNTFPIVLVHGFLGWGRDQAYGSLLYQNKYYWGGNLDLQTELTARGFDTYTAAVGPVSSNWDRACELYAQIKGTRVDYGAAHSARYGHDRFGRIYSKPLCEGWGNVDADGTVHKIHLVGHSLGGQTVRTLVQLLAEGSDDEQGVFEAEKATNPDAKISDLFLGGKDWVQSVTTLASPHNGSTLGDRQLMASIASDALDALAVAAGASPKAEEVLDFQLDQFGLKRLPNESLLKYLVRAKQSPIWNSWDSATHDTGSDGAVALNHWVKAQPNVYYFSWACMATVRNPISLAGHQIADVDIMGDKGLYNAQWWMQAALLGSYTRDDSQREIPVIDAAWWPNDGWVNTISEAGPKYGTTDVIVDDQGSAQIGKWNFMGTMNIDHEDIIGRHWDGAEDFYIRLATKLSQLPVTH